MNGASGRFRIRRRSSQDAIDSANQVWWKTRLRQKRIASQACAALAIVGERVSRERDDGDLLQTRIALQLGCGLPPVHFWQEQIHENEIRRRRARESDRFSAGRSLDDLITRRPQARGI